MKAFAKVLSFILNFLGYAAGIFTAVTLIFKLDFTSIFYINTMSSNEALLFNMTAFVAGLAVAGLVLSLLIGEYKNGAENAEFPVFYAIVPILLAIVFIVFGIMGETPREKLIVIASGVLYALLEVLLIYVGSKMFQLFPKEKR
jgi:uncharacterized protein YacL